MKKNILLPIIGLVVIAFVAKQIFSATPVHDAQLYQNQLRDSLVKQQLAASAAIDTDTTDWRYSVDIDKMTSNKVLGADIEALDEIKLSFPYSGGSRLYLRLRHQDGKNIACLQVTKGQFVFSSGTEGSIRARFDDAKPINFDCARSSDYDPKLMFIDGADSFISHLKKAKKALIETNFYQDGLVVSEFKVEGLKWGSNF